MYNSLRLISRNNEKEYETCRNNFQRNKRIEKRSKSLDTAEVRKNNGEGKKGENRGKCANSSQNIWL